MGVKFKIHQKPDSSTKDIVVRISTIANGFVVKAGDKPYYCTTIDDLRAKVSEMLGQFVEQTAIPEVAAQVETKRERR